MSVKPELTLSCLKESRKYQFAECPIGTFIVRLYWADYSKYVPSSKKLDGVHLLKDTKTTYHRVCEFAITSLESLEYLVANCNPATGTKENWFRSVTKQALWKFREYAKVGYQFIRPIKVAIQSVVSQVKQTVSSAVQSAKEAIKKVFRRAPRDWNDCKSAEDVQYIFDRTPAKFRTDKFVANYLAAYEKFVPSVQPVPYISMFNVADLIAAKNIKPICTTPTEALANAPQYGLSIDDIAPALVEQHSEFVEHIPASDSQVRKMMADGYKANARRCKQWVIGVGKSIPGFEIVIKSSDKRKAEVIMKQVIENILLAELSVLQLSDIIAGS